MAHTITLSIPDANVSVMARGKPVTVPLGEFNGDVLAFLFLRGVQRTFNDGIGDKEGEAAIKAVTDKIEQFKAGKISTRGASGGRTTDPVQQELRHMVEARIKRNADKLVAHYGVKNWSEFKESENYKTYFAKYMADEEMLKEAKAAVAKRERSSDIELLPID
jgi:hypothetical protein